MNEPLTFSPSHLLTLSSVAVEAVCACVPGNAVANDEKAEKATGIRTRRIAAEGTSVVDLCVWAAEKAIAETGSKPDDFGAVLFVSFTQPNRMPAAACEAQARLGFPKGIIAFDVSLACSGWGYGLYLAALLAQQTGKKTLLLDGDVQSAKVGRGDGEKAGDVSPLLADAGTATIVSPSHLLAPSPSHPLTFAFLSDGEKGGALQLKDGGTIQMDGFGVFRFVATNVVSYIKDFTRLLTLLPSHPLTFSPSHPLTFVPHQPNVYMVRQLAKSVGIAEEQTAISCDELGNLSSASIPATIAWKGVRGRILFAGFGGGLSVSLGLIEIDPSCKLSVLEV